MRAIQARPLASGPRGGVPALHRAAAGGARRVRLAHAVPPSNSSGGGSGREAQQDLLLATCPVPREQQPIFQLQSLLEDSSFDLARQPLSTFSVSLARNFAGFFFLMGLPVSAFTFDFSKEPAQCLLSAAAGSLFVVTVLVWRLYLGWDHVGTRLQSATVEYEETGWYDGQMWVKTPEVLARDRLAFAYQIRPAMQRLKSTLLGLGGALAASVILLAALPPPEAISSDYTAPSTPAAPTAAAARPYEERLAAFEPWAATDDSQAPGEEGMTNARPSLLDHMGSLQ